MIYIGLDVHQKSTTICIQDDLGKQLLLEKCVTTFDGFRDKLSVWFKDHPACPVGMEACSKAYITSGIIAELGGEPHVYPADEVASKTRSRKKKTDARDAQDLCTNMRTGALMREVSLPPDSMRKLRSLLKARQLQVKIQTQVVNAAKALLREYGLEGSSGSMTTEAAWKVRLSQPMPKIVKTLFETCFSSFLLASEQVKELMKHAAILSNTNPAFNIAQSIPGVGLVTGLALAAHLFEISRFKSGKKVIAYIGLCPSSYDSGERERKGRITREGPSLLRALLVECAQQASRRKNPLNPYYRRYIVKHGVNKAKVAIAAKLCRIVHSLVKRQEYFSDKSLGVIWDKTKMCYVFDKSIKLEKQSQQGQQRQQRSKQLAY